MILITQVGQVVSRLTIVDRDTHKDNISVSFSRVHARIGDVIREKSCLFKKTNKCAHTADNKITGYSSRAALAKDMLVIPLGKKSRNHIYGFGTATGD